MQTVKTERFKGYYISTVLGNEEEEFKRGLGIHHNKFQSILAAKAENHERSTTIYTGKNQLKFDSFSSFRKKCITKNDLMKICDDFRSSEEYYWTTVNNYKEKKQNLIPASAVFFSFQHDKNPPLRNQTSVGTGAHTSFQKAWIKSVFEIIERHYYYKSLIGENSYTLISNAGNISFFYINNPLECHIILAIMENETIPYISGGICAHSNMEKAIRHAEKEAYLTSWVASNYQKKIIADERILLQYIDQPFFQYAFDIDNKKCIEKWKENEVPVTIKEAATFDSITEKIIENFGNIYFKNFSDKNTEFNVVRSIIPGAITNYFKFRKIYPDCPMPLF